METASVNVRVYYTRSSQFCKSAVFVQTPAMEVFVGEGGTHTLVYEGSVEDHAPSSAEQLLDTIFDQLQFEMVVTDWAQAALESIKRAAVGHTSISVGDIVEFADHPGGFGWMVAPNGWTFVVLVGGVRS